MLIQPIVAAVLYGDLNVPTTITLYIIHAWDMEKCFKQYMQFDITTKPTDHFSERLFEALLIQSYSFPQGTGHQWTGLDIQTPVITAG